MADQTQAVQFGAVTVTVLKIGDFHAPLWDTWLNLTPESWALLNAGGPIGPIRLPIQCFHVAMPGASLLIDAGAYPILDEQHPFAIAQYQPPPGLLEQLAQARIDAHAITHVIITHGHFDHYNGLTISDDQGPRACFPNARHYLGKADWEHMQPELHDPQSVASQALALVEQQGLLNLVEGDCTLEHGLQIIAAPGETAGHQIVRIQCDDQILYFLGDLYHHVLEVEHPDWAPQESDDRALYRSRQQLTACAYREQADLFATHIPSAGRLERAPTGMRWRVVTALADLQRYPLRVAEA